MDETTRDKLFDFELQAIANGGRLPSLEEINAKRRNSPLERQISAVLEEFDQKD